MMEIFSSARADGADKTIVATSAVVAAEFEQNSRERHGLFPLFVSRAPLSPIAFRDNMGAPVNT